MLPVSRSAGIAGTADHRKIVAARRSGLFAGPRRAYLALIRKRRTVMVELLRMDITKFAPDAYRHLFGIEQEIAAKVDKSLLHLIKVRASQINGCAFCIGMHTDEALRDGEKPERLLLLDAWHESSAFNEKERAALEWVEEITLISEGHAHKEAFDALKPHFSEEEIGWLTLAATMINTWNRLAIASRAQYDREQFKQRVSGAKVPEPA
jgi:AhpD family alkylhydroperoxidase